MAVKALALAATFATLPARASDPAFDAASIEFFEKQVRPLLAGRCQKCHGASAQKGGLRLDSRNAVLKGGESGPAAVPGKPEESLLVEAVNYGETVQMPPKTRLPAGEVEVLLQWVARGLPWPEERAPLASNSGNRPAFDLKARAAAHWAWRPVQPRRPPPVRGEGWPLGPVDRFVLGRLEARNIPPAPEADRRTLVRRLTFVLTGLPPSPSEVDAFEGDPRPDAYERLVDRLLASPRFGERWGRHWLDLVRYAESRGHEYDADIPNAWRYRDYVVRALNADVPFDRFLTEHVAGDLLSEPRLDPSTGANESILGTGFWFLGEEVHSPVDLRQDEADRLDNRVDVLTKAFLGLTVACARCHDHKFDAISQRDYYALTGFLQSSSYRQVRFSTLDRERQAARGIASIEAAARPRLTALAAKAARPGVERLAETLLAASRPCEPSESRAPTAARWAAEVSRARADRSHPLHPFAALACDAPQAGVGGWDGPEAEGLVVPTGGRLIVDFGQARDLVPFQDGFAFGLRPARPGEVRVTGEPDSPRLGVFDLGAAHRQDGWPHLNSDTVSQRDHGRLGTWDRAGQTLRTPEFTLRSGRLWYLADGAGRAYASVQSHLLIAGPLHGALLTEWTDGGKGLSWVRHDLSAYTGHRVHLEFSPAGTGSVAIAAVVEADREPEPVSHAARALGRALLDSSGGRLDGPAELARAYQTVFLEALRRIGADRVGEPPDGPGFVALAGWLLGHLDLFAPADDPAFRALRVEAGRLIEERRRLAGSFPATAPTAPAILDGNGVDAPLLVRGSARTPGDDVPRRFLEAIAGDAPSVDPAGGSGRLELARWMLAPDNPFTRRAVVNRVWHHLFGRGIVASVDNLGALGEPPTHPELLDHLADTFVKEGWSLKRLIRTLVLSRTYRMASRPDPAADALDPGNRLWHRMTVRRLAAEPIRDAVLAVSGRLDERPGGPGVPIHLTPFLQGRGRPKSGPVDGDGRRSIYLAVRRNFLAPMLLAFDAPIPFTTIGHRNVSNVPAQALILMNDPFVVGQARRWAARVLKEGPAEPSGRVAAMYRAAFARPPGPSEVDEALAFLRSQAGEYSLRPDAWRDDPRPWADLAHVLFNAKEFVFVE
jgi:hypothetical protein